MNLFLQYLKQKRWAFIAEFLFLSIFLITFALYKLPLKAVLYPTLLCFFGGIPFILADFIHNKQKYEILAKMRTFTDIMIETLPTADGMVEKAYQDIISTLKKEHSDIITNSNLKYNEMMDYYTVWAHQIKTPIASMRLTLQNEDTVLSRGLSNDLFRIEQYVEMVLTFLRLDSKSSDYVIKEYDLDKIVKQSVKKFAGEFISRKLSLIYDPLNTTVITDEKWLSFVIEQILSNALKYTPSGSIAITLESGHKLCIRDTGIGIAAEDLPRIFENGYTGYNGRADKKASGIGLYLCKNICQKLGHSITAKSKIDVGTTIIIDLSQQKLYVE